MTLYLFNVLLVVGLHTIPFYVLNVEFASVLNASESESASSNVLSGELCILFHHEDLISSVLFSWNFPE